MSLENTRAQITELRQAMAEMRDAKMRVKEACAVEASSIYRDPKDVYHQISLGSVLTARGLIAGDARPFDGLLSIPAGQVIELLQHLTDGQPVTFDHAIRKFIDDRRVQFEGRGRFVEWRRACRKYRGRHDRFLAMLDVDVARRWRSLSPTSQQTRLIQRHCDLRNEAFPALATRGEAYDWLAEKGGNPSFLEDQQ